MFKFSVNGKNYEITYENLEFNINAGDFDVEDVKVFCDGKEQSDFGVSFVGHQYDADEVLLTSILAYINNDKSFKFIEIPTRIKSLKAGFFKKKLTTNGRDIPEQFITSGLDICDVVMITKNGNAAYIGGDGSILTYPDGSIATDIENFFMDGVVDLYKEDPIVFIDPQFKEDLDDYVDESKNIKSVINRIIEGVDVRKVLLK